MVQRTTGYRFCASAFHHDFPLSIRGAGTCSTRALALVGTTEDNFNWLSKEC